MAYSATEIQMPSEPVRSARPGGVNARTVLAVDFRHVCRQRIRHVYIG